MPVMMCNWRNAITPLRAAHCICWEIYKSMLLLFVLCFWECFFLWPVSQRKHVRCALLKALMVLPPSSACWECFSLAGGLPGTPQEPEVNDSGAEILVIEPLAIDLHQWYITAKYSWVVGVLRYSTVTTLITSYFCDTVVSLHWQKSKSSVWSNPSL